MKATQYVDIVGRNSVADCLRSDKKVSFIYVTPASKQDDKVAQVLKVAQGKGVSIEVVNQDDLDKRFPDTPTQGIVAQVDLGEMPTLKQILANKRDPLILLYNHLDYEQNLGAILRTAWASKVDAVVANNEGIHEITPVVAKVSMGAAAYVPVIGMSLYQAIDQIKDAAIWITGVEVNMGKPYYQESLTGGQAFIFGGESVGLTEPLVKRCDRLINIPMFSSIASLNVSVSTAIILFDRLRQKNSS